MIFRRSELHLLSFFLYVSMLATVLPVSRQIAALIWTTNAAITLWFSLFAWADRSKGFTILDYVRDFFPLPLILLAFREMGWLDLPHTGHGFENFWIHADRYLLHTLGLKAAVESLGPVLPSILEAAYLTVYSIPVLLVLAFYRYGARRRLDDAYSILLFATLTTYALFPYFPSEPPRLVFPQSDLPLPSLLRSWNLQLLDAHSIHLSVFPSGHCAAAFGAAFAVWRLLPEPRWLRYAFLILAILIGIATVYGRYHYAVDAVAGLAMALLSLGLTRFWMRSRQPLR